MQTRINISQDECNRLLDVLSGRENFKDLIGRLDSAFEDWPTVEYYRNLAKDYCDDDTTIDDDAAVSLADAGAWVQVWLWIADEANDLDDDLDEGVE